jgi:hypothetical protein
MIIAILFEPCNNAYNDMLVCKFICKIISSVTQKKNQYS